MGHELELDVGPADLIKIVRRLSTEYQKISPRHTIHFESDVRVFSATGTRLGSSGSSATSFQTP
jgi:hypothetical protein